MILTGQCKKDFEKWYKDKYYFEVISYDKNYVNFMNIPNSMQFGVLVDFFDKVGLEMTDFKWRGKFTAALYIDDDMKISDQIGKDKGFKKRDDARIFIVKKTNDYYNLNEYNYELE
jgi:hypothetical protein